MMRTPSCTTSWMSCSTSSPQSSWSAGRSPLRQSTRSHGASLRKGVPCAQMRCPAYDMHWEQCWQASMLHKAQELVPLFSLLNSPIPCLNTYSSFHLACSQE